MTNLIFFVIRKVCFQRAFLLGLCVLIAAPLAGQTIQMNAPDGERTALHSIQRGETLFKIAGKYGTTVEKLMELNGLRDHFITAGKSLVVPAGQHTRSMNPRGSDASLSATQPDIEYRYRDVPQLRASNQAEMARVEKKRFHEVRQGEDVYSIARRYRVSPEQIKEWNASSQVRAGQTIIVNRWYEEVPMDDLRGYAASEADMRREPLSWHQSAPAQRVRSLDQTLPQPEMEFGAQSLDLLNDDPYAPLAQRKRSPVGTTRSVAPTTISYDESQHDLVYRYVSPEAEAAAASRRVESLDQAPSQVNMEYGPFLPIKSADMRNQRFYAIHKTLPKGSKVRLQIPNNGGFVEVEIVGRLSPREDAIIGLSPACVALLQGTGLSMMEWITIEH